MRRAGDGVFRDTDVRGEVSRDEIIALRAGSTGDDDPARIAARGVIVTSRADGKTKYDFVSRFFAPQSGVPEDPVTGSAHCALAPYWSAKLGKKELIAYQASARGGELRLRLEGDRVKLGGQAVTVLRGELSAGNMAS